MARLRLTERCGLVEGVDFALRGVPHDLEDARELRKRDKHRFESWIIEHVDGFVTDRRTGDGGLDGRLYFAHPAHRELQSMAVEVKDGGSVDVADVLALDDSLRRKDAILAGLIVMDQLPARKEPTFRRLMTEAGELDVLGMKYPRIQMLTVSGILAGERFNIPGDGNPGRPPSGSRNARRP